MLKLVPLGTPYLIPHISGERLNSKNPHLLPGLKDGGLSLATRWSMTNPATKPVLPALERRYRGSEVERARLISRVCRDLSAVANAKEEHQAEQKQCQSVSKENSVCSALSVAKKPLWPLW
jgi:hypothetical protein